MSSEELQNLQAQRTELDKKIERLRKREWNTKLKEIVATMQLFNISIDDIQMALSLEMKKQEMPRAKYQDPETGKVWSGKGSKPKWLKTAIEQGHKLEEFLIQKKDK